jgi:glycosyltransferase involved in cell wall biosynthesis
MSIPRASVLLPVHNGAATLAAAIQSIADQTIHELELIIVDDGSTDATPSIIGKYVAGDARMRCITFERNVGIVVALNAALSSARAPFIARMDADDWSHPTRLEQQLELFDLEQSIGVVSCLVRHVTQAGSNDAIDGMGRYVKWLNELVSSDRMATERFVESPVAHPSVIIRRCALDSVGGWHQVPWAEDYDLWLRLMASGWKFAKVPEVLLDWYDSTSRISRRDQRYSLEQFMACKANHLAALPQVKKVGVAIAGAGPTGKSIGHYLQCEGIRIHRYYDVHPRRIGGHVHGVPVCSAEAIEPWNEQRPVHLAAAGLPEAREAIRQLLVELGYAEGSGFFCVA